MRAGLLALARPTWIAAGVAAAVVMAAMSCVVALTPSLLHRLLDGRVALESLEHEYYLFDQLIRSRQLPKGRETVRIAVVGGSSMVESIWSAEDLSEKISARLDADVTALDLTTGGQSLLTSWALVAKLACEGADMVGFSLSLGRTSQDFAFGIAAPMKFEPQEPEVARYIAEEIHRRQQPRAIMTASDETRFLVRTLGLAGKVMLRERLNHWRDPARYPIAQKPDSHPFMVKPRMSPSAYAARFEAVTKRDVTNNIHSDRNWRLFLKAEESVRRCGSRFVVIINAVNPVIWDRSSYPLYMAAQISFMTKLAEVAKSRGMAVIDLNKAADFVESDFFDYIHLADEARIKETSDYLAGELARLLSPPARTVPNA